MQYTSAQLKEIRDVILPKKAEEMRHILLQLDTPVVAALFNWSTQYQDTHAAFFRECLAAYAIKDLYVMCDVVLGYNHVNYGADMNQALHGGMCARLDNRPSRRLGWLVAREHLKTQVITIADTIRRIALSANQRILIASGIRDNAVKMLGSVKVHWDTNQTLQMLYPYRLPAKGMTWNEDALVFSGRTTVFKEPCVEARGAESELTSAHYDVGKWDDLVGRENSSTDEQLAKTIEWWRKAQPILTPTAELDLVGTPHSDADLYMYLMEIKSHIDWFLAPVTHVNEETGEEIRAWPEYHSIESLEQKKIDMGPQDYAAQMMIDPIPKGAGEFQDHYFYVYDDDELDFKDIRHRGTVCDPAYTKKGNASKSVNPDSSGIITGGWHPKHGLVVVDIDHGQLGVEKTVDCMHRQQAAWGSKVGVETQSALDDYLRLHNEQKKSKFIRYVKLKSGNFDKDSRIRTLIPTAAAKPIWLPRKNPHTATMLAQFKRFPKSKKRDLMDALAYLPQMVKAVRSGRSEEDVTFRMGYQPDSETTGY